MSSRLVPASLPAQFWSVIWAGLLILGSASAEPLTGLSRTLVVDNSYLLVPVGNLPERDMEADIRIGIYTKGEKIQDFRVRLPAEGESPWWAAYPLDSFGLYGKEITLRVEDIGSIAYNFAPAFCQIRIGPDVTKDAPEIYHEPYRNQFHVSAGRGWNNDPNGLVYHDGLYHLFYQFNPFGIFWGNMHWGHFTSRDLVHWEPQPIALYQKTVKDMAYSGGGFVDFNNSAGLGKGTLFVAFTSTGRGECLAYSHDGGLTFTELPENPVVRHDGRDPKVIWYEPEQKWVMVVYNAEDGPETRAIAPAEGKQNRKRRYANIAFYESRDLRHWSRTGSFTDPDRTAVFECPELFELPVEGTSGESRWILFGAQNRYFIGHFDGKVFHKESGPHGEEHGAFYAAQTFSQVPDSRRIQIGWVRTESYFQRFSDQWVNQALSLPHTLTLHRTPDGLRVFFNPVKEVKQLRSELIGQGEDLSWREAQALLDSCKGALTEVLITFEEEGEHRLSINGMDAGFTGRGARIFTDRTFNEVYVDGGRKYWIRTLPPENFEARPTRLQGQAERIKSIRIFRLKSIWPDVESASPVADAVGPMEWPEIETTHRPGTFWWWPGSAVDEANITANLEAMSAAGMGGATVVAIYGAQGAEDRYVDYLTPEWLELFSHAGREAERLGMWLDLTPGTGWPFGGPMVSEDHYDARADFSDGLLQLEFSGRRVKRAAPGSEGYALNPFSSKAMASYLEHFDRAFAEVDNLKLPRAFYHDSFEYKGNWSPGFLEAFRELREYELEPYLPILFGEDLSEKTGRIKADYRETLSDLHLEYIKLWVEWAKKRGVTTRNQAHGAPANLLDLYAAAGIPETETFGATPFQIPGSRFDPAQVSDMGPPRPLINRMASSAAHVSGEPLVAAETATWLRNHFRASLAQAKPEIDQLFLNGINHIFFHGTCYSPAEASWPGWLFYASLQYNPRNSIWRDAPALNAYIAHCQSILQSGDPDNDVALYWPVHDIWQDPYGMEQMLTVHHAEWLLEAPCGKIAEWLIDRGYGFDYISDRQLVEGKGEGYSAVVVPAAEYMPIKTLVSLKQLSEKGVPVLFVDRLPRSVPGFYQWQERESVLRDFLAESPWKALTTDQLQEALGDTRSVREPMKRRGLDFIRRAHPEGAHYFIANMGSQPVDRWIRLGRPFSSVVIMDPQTGETGVAQKRKGDEVYLQLEPGETRFLRTFDTQKVNGPDWPVWERTGPVVPLKGVWQVDFIEGEPQLPRSFATEILGSWTASGDPEAERFAGTARYSLEFELPDTRAEGWFLNLGDVRENARVFINGKKAAVLYSSPFRAEVGKYLQPGRNRIEIEVTNLSANRIRDLDIQGIEWKIFHDINFVDHRYNDFDASLWELVPSGLQGPVSLQPLRKVSFGESR